MAKNMDVPLLYDFYGDMLTDKQRDMIEQYYDQDLSLSEIAENAGISRQGVRDSVKRAEMQLIEMEERLGVVAKVKAIQASLELIEQHADSICKTAIAHDEKEIEDDASNLLLLIEKLRKHIM
ncbi:MAG: DNA-binding protein [Clostridia bacterium]|nr:DNA-binding protein [Clostridia bacterium]